MASKEMSQQDRIKEELEIVAAMQANCSIRFRQPNGAEVTMETQIQRLYVEDGVYYVSVNDGLQIPLDQIIKVNGIGRQLWC